MDTWARNASSGVQTDGRMIASLGMCVSVCRLKVAKEANAAMLTHENQDTGTRPLIHTYIK
jgi:hypothetical protein